MPALNQGKGAYNAVKQTLSIFSPFNKVGDTLGTEDGTPDLIASYRSDLPDEEIISLKNQWKREYAQYYRPIEKVQQTGYDYWVGKQTKNSVEDMLDANRSLVDN